VVAGEALYPLCRSALSACYLIRQACGGVLTVVQTMGRYIVQDSVTSSRVALAVEQLL